MNSRYYFFLILMALLMVSCKNPPEAKSEAPKISVENIDGRAVSIASLESYISEQMQQMKIPGLSFALINNGKLVYHRVLGLENKNSGNPVTETTLFEGASTSKALFAYLCLFLVEEGLLDLDQPVIEYLDPKWYDVYNADERFRQITPRMVLSHTTGFPNWREEQDIEIHFDPGTDFGYSGEGYQYLVRGLESKMKTDYTGLEAYFQEKIAIPLGMEHTKFVQDDYNLSHKATPHQNGMPMPVNLWTAKEFNAASALHSEANEFCLWIMAVMNNSQLKQQSLNLFFQEQITVAEAPKLLSEEGAVAWTLGLAKYELEGYTVYGHEGNNDGFNALFLLNRDKKWAMIQFNNANEVYDFGFNIFRFLHTFKETE